LPVDATRIESTCDCGEDLSGPLDITIGRKVLRKSWHEYNDYADFSLSIVLAAMAFECELSRLYIKWTRVDEVLKRGWTRDEELEERLRTLGGIDKKMELVASLMFPNGLTAFLDQNAPMSQVVRECFPSLDGNALAVGITRNLFWPRNRVLHLGKQETKETAVKAFNISNLAITIFESLDQHRRLAGSSSSGKMYDY